jgi:ABC-type lipoprotein export system ATPase subunit
MNKMLELKGVTKGFLYGEERQEVLRGIDLKFEGGKWYTIYGPSGSGKTTLLDIAGGLSQPDSGTVLYDGGDIYKTGDRQLSRWRNLKIGFVFQLFHLIEELNVAKNILLPAEINSSGSDRKWFETLINILGLGKLLNRRPSTLSGGEKQRVAMARALINRPEFILADEPTGNLDSENSKIAVDLLGQLKETASAGIILATHEKEFAGRGDFRLHLKDGKVLKGD